jgi:hypothetical protein
MQKVVQYIERHKLFSLDDKILVALSGGADSVALLRLLLSLGYTCEAAAAGAGADALLGGFGDDFYVQYIGYGNGRDTINDGVTASYTPGYGGGNGDTLYLPNVLLSQVYVARQADNLWLSSMADASDGQITEGVVITNFFQGGIYTIEYLRTQDAVISLSGAFGVV